MELTDRQTHADRILQVLAASPSGEMTSSYLLETLVSAYGHSLTKTDLKLQDQSDRSRVQPKWETRVGKTKSWMVERGLIEATPPKIWRLSPVGRSQATNVETEEFTITSTVSKPLAFGEIAGYPALSEFPTREAAYNAGVHRMPRGRISGGSNGVDAICISQVYEGDYFTPELIMYTGAGGMRDKEWFADQMLTNANLGLARAMDDGSPVRVLVKKSNLPAGKQNTKGYVYVGLYFVTHWDWIDKEEQYKVLQFQLQPLPGVAEGIRDAYYAKVGSSVPPRVPVTINRIVRDAEVVRKVKRIYENTCQICSTQLQTATGSYSEAAHIKPLGAPHHGVDQIDNVLCLCPNCHKRFDGHGLAVDEHLTVYDFHKLKPEIGTLNLRRGHELDLSNLSYQFEAASNSRR